MPRAAFQHLIALCIAVVLGVQIYVLAAYAWSGYGGTSFNLFKVEMPLALLLALLMYAPQARHFRWHDGLHALLPLLVFYVAYDVYHHVFSRSLRVSDLQEFRHLRELEPRVFLLVVTLTSALALMTGWRHWRWLSKLTPTRAFSIVVVKASVFVGLAVLLQSPGLHAALLQSDSFVGYNDWKNIKTNGRMTGALFYEARQQQAQIKLLGTQHPAIYSSFYQAPLLERRNVHVIVLESFMDPRKLSGVDWTPSPLCPRLLPFLGGRDLSVVQSPVYGGFTAQAEFELLAGLPALRLVNGIEFNSLEGHPTSTWVRKLQQAGYRTVASYATHSGFYNTRRAYPSMGFDELHGIDNAPYFSMPAGEKILADSLLYAANRKLIADDLLPRQPFVNYVLTMQGHYPYTRDPVREPTVVQPVSGNGVSADLINIANLFYHRSCALADFLTDLQRMDPQAVVLAVSDHLPPDIISQGIGYPPGHFMNVALMLDRFKPVDLSGRKYHEIPHVLWGRLAGQDQAALSKWSSLQLEALYLSLHAEGITPVASRKPQAINPQGAD